MHKRHSPVGLFRALSIKGKLAAIVLLASGFALLTASVAIVILDRIAAKEAMVRDTGTLADMIAATSTAAVAFSSQEDADEILAALHFRKDVKTAHILDAAGKLFAHFPGDAPQAFEPRIDSLRYAGWFSDHGFHLARPILLNGKPIGELVMTVSTDILNQRLARWLWTVLIVSVLAFLIGFSVTRTLHRSISDPISTLVHVAKQVSTTKDYSIRAAPGNDDELGVLVYSFNEMLSQVAQRDDALREARDTLEIRVEDRTAALTREVAERENAEKSLDLQRTFLRQLIDSNPNLIYVKDRDGRYELVNKALASQFGASVDAVVGKTDSDFNLNETEVQAFLRDDREVMDGKQEKFIMEEAFTPPLGQTTWMQTIKIPLIAIDGSCDRILGVATDITARKTAEIALRASEEQLRQSVKMEAIGRLAGGVAHDFNNLLAVIMGRSELLVASMGESHPLLAPIQEIDSAAQRAALLTKQLLAFSRRQVLAAKPMNLNDCVENMETMLRRLISEDIAFSCVLAPTTDTVLADSGQVEQVVMNLVVNARDASPAGGSITIRTGNAHLPTNQQQTDSGIAPGIYAFISVADTGSGMDEATQSRVFEPFFTTKDPSKGTGLGLSTVYGIVKQSGGHVEVESKIGVGTTFTVYLPKIETILSRAADFPTALQTSDRETGHTILLIEDESGVRELVRQTLSTAGYDVLSAEDGVQAIAISDNLTGAIDLVVSDVVMPGLSGPDTVARLKVTRPDLRVVYMSGYLNDNIIGTSSVLLQKPFRLDALREVVANALVPNLTAVC